MTITVLLNGEDSFKEIPDFLLDEFIVNGKVKAFLRSDGWAIIGQHPVRSRRSGDYDGPERRMQRKKSCIICPDMDGGICKSKSCGDRYKQTKYFSYA